MSNVPSTKQKPLPKRPPEKQGFYCVGVVFDAHGIKGEVKLKAFTENDLILNQYPNAVTETGQTFTVKKARAGKGIILDLAEVKNRNDAEALVGTYLYLPNETLPETAEDEITYHQLMGMNVALENGDDFGKVTDVFDNGAQAVLVINHQEKEVLVPFVEQYILEINSEGNKLVASEDIIQFAEL